MPVTHRDVDDRGVSAMGTRSRKLIGTVVMLAFIIFYALFAMAVAEGRITQAPKLLQTLAYIVLGLIWIVPLMPLIRWMAKPDSES
jgi:predicted membrane channel-forming protein YqfA (hemolysin III family)